MGMAASQARFLGLTARKTNVEYQGQQVNQARTVLSNESAGLFNEMMGLKVPTPPVVGDYYTSRYEFETGTMADCTILSMTPTGGADEYSVSMSYKAMESKGYKMTGSESEFTKDGSGWKFGIFPLVTVDANDKDYIDAIRRDQKIADTQNFAKYIDTDKKATYYVFEPPSSGTTYNSYRYYTAEKEVPKTATGVGKFTKEDSGRFTSVNFSSTDSPDVIQTDTNYDLGINKEYDDLAYDKAMKSYDYAKMVYEQQIQIINSKTQKLQVEDRSLELKLRQLDTEQKALQTEMESVQKVIQKNVETVFKTFA